MATDDFDVDSLAAYLHMTPPQVLRLADRGKLPGRKVGGEWRFSQQEMHHWLETRIGLSDEEELVEVERVLQRRGAPGEDQPILISELLRPEAIEVPLGARTRGSVIREMTRLAAATGLLWDAEKMAEAVQAREDLYPTTTEGGVALLHPRRPLPSLLAEPLLALGITQGGIAFGGGRSALTDVFFLICSVSDPEHLRTLARLSRLIGDADWMQQIRRAPDPAAVHTLIAAWDAKLA